MDWLEVTLAPAAVAPGETVEVDAVWRLADEPRALELRLFWATAGKGDQDLEVVAVESLAPTASGQGRIRFTIPELGPCSFSGKLISLSWAVELVAEPGARAGRAELVVSPIGRELRLGAVGGGNPDASS